MSVVDDTEIKISKWRVGFWLALLLVAVAIFLPHVQAILYEIFVGTPSVAQWGIVALIIAGVGAWRGSRGLLVFAAIVFVLMGLLVGPVVSGIYAHTYMANQMQSEATELDTLPNTSMENVRVLPRSVSDNYAQSSMQYPQFQLTESDITYQNGTYKWSHGLAPDAPLVSWFGQQRGALFVNMTTTDKQVTIDETQFKNGRGQVFFDSYQYQSVLHSPFKKHNWGTTFNARVDGQSYIAHSTTTYEWKFRATPIPQFYAVPQHGSVEVMEPNGDIDSLTPQEAQQSELLRGQNFYPYSIAMFKVESMQYVHGALNKWFWKEDVLSIADLPEGGNQWPLTVPTQAGGPELTYFIATEPTGSGNGVYEIWTIDSQTGEAGVQKYDDSQIGPQKAVDFVERRQEVNRLSNAQAVAPVPVVKGDTLYWHVKVVPKSNSGVIYTAFVNAQSGDVTLVDGTEPIYAFLTKGEVQEVQDGTRGESEGMAVTVVVTNDQGEIVGTENITVPRGGGVNLNLQTGNQSNATATP